MGLALQHSDRPLASGGCSRFIAKLSAVSVFSAEEEEALERLCDHPRLIAARTDIISDGDEPRHVHIMLEGWAARYKLLSDGSRQITAFLLPGDMCDLHITILKRMDHGIVALTPTKVAFIAHQVMEELPLDRPALGRALWRATLIDEAVLRSWIVNVGGRPGEQRIAHLLCELHARLSLVGLVHEEGTFSFPLTQEVIADATGLTAVHVNRMLQKLRADGAIVLNQGELVITDIRELARIADFDPDYLHRDGLVRN